MGFATCCLMIPPTSGKVCSFLMRQAINGATEGREAFDKGVAALENYYKIKGKQTFPIDLEIVFNLDNGGIVLKLNMGVEENSFVLRGYSKEFVALSDKEEKDLVIRSTAPSRYKEFSPPSGSFPLLCFFTEYL